MTATPECEFHDVLTEERCSDFRCRPYHVHLADGRVLERWLCDLHALMSEPEAVPAGGQPSSTNAATE